MNFIELSFPDNISIGATGGPTFLTTIATTTNKAEIRSSNWQTAKNIYYINCNTLNNKQVQSIIAFFNICRGMATGFRFKDYNDYQAKSSYIDTADGIKKQYSLQKSYIFGNYSYYKRIYKPILNSVNIYLNGSQISSGFLIDDKTGIITFDNPVAAGTIITADFEFDVPVRFNSDSLSFSYQNKNQISVEKIELTEISLVY